MKIFRNILINVGRYKYLLVIVLVAVWMAFFDRYSIITRIEDEATVNKLKQENLYYKQEIARVKNTYEELQKDPKQLEKFAREHYLMHKDGEDVFLVDKNY